MHHPSQGRGPGGRSAFPVAVQIIDRLSFVVTHGFTDRGRFDDTWVYLGLTNTWPQPLTPPGTRPIARCLMRAVGDPERSRGLIFGGRAGGALNDVWELSFEG